MLNSHNMFARPRPKKLLAPPPKKRKRQHTLEEIKFDNDARAEYLTGFHKRKLQRAKHAQEQAAERARQEKIEARKQTSLSHDPNQHITKQIREDRKRQVEEHVQSVNEALKQAAQAGYIDSEGSESSDEDSAEEWGGFEDTSGQQDTIDHEEQYVDEDRYTTVTVESVNVSRDGLTSSRPDEEGDFEDKNHEDGEKDLDKKTAAQSEKTGSRDKHAPKKKKQRFRYETKLERQITNIKQKAKNKRRPRG
ncbi:hypothetical protein RRF57_006446 [Xylaria bambusicola]|uniref:Ribosomal RNA-processing protein 17 n=1 Tax=Xylaria bambusicola TaxID=326684 RepID=A0AAN7US49_9PEZI